MADLRSKFKTSPDAEWTSVSRRLIEAWVVAFISIYTALVPTIPSCHYVIRIEPLISYFLQFGIQTSVGW